MFIERPKNREKTRKEKPEIVERKLEKLREGLEATKRYLEADPEEKEGDLLKSLWALEKSGNVSKEQFLKDWRRRFWGAEKRYAEIPRPEKVFEQNRKWNSGKGSLEGLVLDGFKQIGQLITDEKELGADGIIPSERRKAEITVVDRKKDKDLDDLCKWARGLKETISDEEERAFILVRRVYKRMGGHLDEKGERAIREMERDKGELFLGKIKFGSGRHRGLLFQVLAEEAGIKSRMMKTILPGRSVGESSVIGVHQYNQVFLKTGEILIVDAMFPPGAGDEKKDFEDLSSDEFKKKWKRFPRLGSNRLNFPAYVDPESGAINVARWGANGLGELLKRE